MRTSLSALAIVLVFSEPTLSVLLYGQCGVSQIWLRSVQVLELVIVLVRVVVTLVRRSVMLVQLAYFRTIVRFHLILFSEY